MPEYRSYPPNGISMSVRAEAPIPATVRRELERRGHKVELFGDWDGGVGAMSGILIHPMSGVYMGGADPRRQYAALAW
jgi:gamma-glutamyltranspeptidase/glutathione hydrolase